MGVDQLYEFTVEGSHSVTGDRVFPFWMMSINRCWPKDKRQATVIESTMETATRRPFRVTLVGLDPPMSDAWESAGWRVLDKMTLPI